jgi:hypothetical protein
MSHDALITISPLDPPLCLLIIVSSGGMAVIALLLQLERTGAAWF